MEAVNLLIFCQAMVTELLPSDRGQVSGPGEVELCSNMKRLHLQSVGAGIQKMRLSWLYCTLIVFIHVAYVQQRGRDKDDVRSFTTAYSS